MPHEDVPVMDDLVRSSGSSTASLEHIRSVESMSNRSSSTSMNNSYHSASFRHYVELPQLEPLSFATTEPMLDDLLVSAYAVACFLLQKVAHYIQFPRR